MPPSFVDAQVVFATLELIPLCIAQKKTHHLVDLGSFKKKHGWKCHCLNSSGFKPIPFKCAENSSATAQVMAWLQICSVSTDHLANRSADKSHQMTLMRILPFPFGSSVGVTVTSYFWLIIFRCSWMLQPFIILSGGWFQPLWKILVSWDYDIPNIWGKKSYSKPPTIYNPISGFHECCHS